MKSYLLIAFGSALGGVARHWISTLLAARLASPFPWPTFVVNVLGSALIGFVLALPDSRLTPSTRQFLTVGILGGFTTFSAFSAQTFALFQAGKQPVAIAYILASITVCVLGCWIGWTLAHAK
jgi:CrcB protein